VGMKRMRDAAEIAGTTPAAVQAAISRGHLRLSTADLKVPGRTGARLLGRETVLRLALAAELQRAGARAADAHAIAAAATDLSAAGRAFVAAPDGTLEPASDAPENGVFPRGLSLLLAEPPGRFLLINIVHAGGLNIVAARHALADLDGGEMPLTSVAIWLDEIAKRVDAGFAS
jgi:hypothetical protein